MSPMPKVIHSVHEWVEWRKSFEGRIGLVPTMGALHEGHATLLRRIRSRCDISVLSIFVNPTQFGPKEDFSKYPRTFEADLQTASREGVDLVFAPTADELYPSGFSTYIEETQLSRNLCGKFRPVFFRGVTTVVLKLFNLIRPELAFFGLKDAQQFFVIDKMVRDLHLGIRIEGIPTVRDTDGLALSSRNAYLSQEERKTAPALFQELSGIRKALLNPKSAGLSPNSAGVILADPVKNLIQDSKLRLEKLGFQVQYLECLALPELTEHQDYRLGLPCLIAVAAFLGTTRLIDNVMIYPEKLPQSIATS